MPDLSSNSTTTAFSVVLTWCCYAIGEMSESHDANQAIFGQTQALLMTPEQTHMQTPHASSICLQNLLTLLSFYGESDRNLCILLCQCIRQLLECSESNKLQVALNSDVRVVELCIALIHHYMTSGKEVMPWLMNLLATLVSTDVANLGGTVGDGQKLELTLGRMILDCDGALVLIQVLLNYYDSESERDVRKRGDAGENTASGSGSGVGMICLRVLQVLTMLLSVIEHDGNEVVLEEILRSGCVAVIKEIVRRYHEEEEEIVEFAEMILTRLADLETLLLPNHQYHLSG
jgi:hypothetical protein